MKHLSFLILMLCPAFVLHSDVAFAEEAVPQVIVNHATKECAVICSVSDCYICYPPEGWEALGYENSVECPVGYKEVEVEPVIVEHNNNEQFCGPRIGGRVGFLLPFVGGTLLLIVVSLVLQRKKHSNNNL